MAHSPRDQKGHRTARLREDADAAERSGQTKRAIEILEELVGRAPDDRAALRRLAALLARAGRAREANAYHRRLAESYEHGLLHAKAIAAWKQVSQSEPHFAGARVKLGELYASQGLRADARQHYRSALAIYRGTARRREAAQIEERLAELDEMSNPDRRPPVEPAGPPVGTTPPAGADPMETAGRPGAEDAADPPTADEVEFVGERLGHARLFRRYRLHDQARVQLDALLARFPDHPEARRELRDLLQETGRHDEAAEQERALEALERKEPVPTKPGASVPQAPWPPSSPDRRIDGTEAPPRGAESGRDDGGTTDVSEAEVELGDLLGLSALLVEGSPGELSRRVAWPDGLPHSVVAPAGEGSPPAESPGWPSLSERPPAGGSVAVTGAPGVEAGPAAVFAEHVAPDVATDEEAGLEELELFAVGPEPSSELVEPHLPIELDECSISARELRSRVDDQVGRDDYEMRYDLGIAYREMGLLDEAIAELQLASRGPSRLVECASLLAACFVDKGLPKLAVKWLERALLTPGLEEGQARSLRYDLAGVLEAFGDVQRAGDLYTGIYGEDAGFRDVAEKLRRLGHDDGRASADERGVVPPWRER